jgi:hypothetical protein
MFQARTTIAFIKITKTKGRFYHRLMRRVRFQDHNPTIILGIMALLSRRIKIIVMCQEPTLTKTS